MKHKIKRVLEDVLSCIFIPDHGEVQDPKAEEFTLGLRANLMYIWILWVEIG